MPKNDLDSRDLWRKLLDPVRGWYDDGGTVEKDPSVEEDPSDEEILRLVVHDLQSDSKELLKFYAWLQCCVRNLGHMDYGNEVEATTIAGPLSAKVAYMLGMTDDAAKGLIRRMNLDPDDDVRRRADVADAD